MNDRNKTRDQLLDELSRLRRKVASLERTEATVKNTKADYIESERRFEELWEHSPAAFHTLDTKGILTRINQTEAKMLGYAKAEMVGKSIFSFIKPGQRREARRRFREKISGKFLPSAKNRIYIKKDGSEVQVKIFDLPERDNKGRITGIRTAMVNITERKHLEEKLQKKEALFRSLVENSTAGVVTTDLRGRLTYVNRAMSKMLGYPDENMLGKSLFGYLHPEDKKKVKNLFRESSQNPRRLPLLEFRAVPKKGPILHLHSRPSFYKYKGNVSGVCAVVTDLTERKKAEDKLKENEEFLINILESLNDGILVLNSDFQYIYWNRAMEKLSKIPREQLLLSDKAPWEFFPHLKEQGVDDMMRSAMQGQPVQRDDIPFRLRDGTSGYTTELFLPLKSSSGKNQGIIGVIQDTTKRKKVEEELTNERKLISKIMETSPVGITVVDREGRIMFANARAEAVLGLSRAKITQRAYNDPEWRITDYEGNPFPDESLPFQRVMSTGKTVVDARHAIEWPDGRRILLSINAAPLHGHAGKLEGMIAAVEDITDRFKQDKKILDSLKEKEILLQEVHHRVKNNLQVISSLLDLQAQIGKNEQVSEILKTCRLRIKSMATVHEKLYKSKDLSKIDFEEYLRTLVDDLFQSSIPSSERITVDIKAKKIPIGAEDAMYFGLIINELVSNSLKHAFPHNRKGQITIALKPIGPSGLELEVGDNGEGMPKEQELLDKKSLGLRLVKILVEDQLDGTIKMESNGGTKYHIRLRR